MKDERLWLKPLGLIYGGAMAWRNQLYDQGVWRAETVNCPVISVGNLTVGGAGKTPVTMAVLEKLLSQNLKPAVVSRGYGRATSGVWQVDLVAPQAAAQFGDEPVLIKSRFHGVPVYVGEKKVKAARLAIAENQLDVILADDAFQHRALARQLDVVVIDSTQGLGSLYPVPWGMAREKSCGLKRAGIVVLNKVNLSSPELLAKWRTWLSQNLRSTQKVVEAAYQTLPLQGLTGPQALEAKEWLACAGVARPSSFLHLLRKELKLNITNEIWFRDHHLFTVKDLQKIETKLYSGQGIVITEKEAVKWRSLPSPLLERVAVVSLDLKWTSGEEELDRALTAVIR